MELPDKIARGRSWLSPEREKRRTDRTYTIRRLAERDVSPRGALPLMEKRPLRRAPSPKKQMIDDARRMVRKGRERGIERGPIRPRLARDTTGCKNLNVSARLGRLFHLSLPLNRASTASGISRSPLQGRPTLAARFDAKAARRSAASSPVCASAAIRLSTKSPSSSLMS